MKGGDFVEHLIAAPKLCLMLGKHNISFAFPCHHNNNEYSSYRVQKPFAKQKLHTLAHTHTHTHHSCTHITVELYSLR